MDTSNVIATRERAPAGEGPGRGPNFVAVLRGLAAQDADPTIARMLVEMRREVGDGARAEQRGGRSITIDPEEGIAFWTEGDDLVVTNDADGVIAALDGTSPSAATSPILADLGSEAEGFVPVLRGFLDLKALPELPEEAKQLGLGGVERLDLLWGVQGEALRTEFRVVAPSPRTGLLYIPAHNTCMDYEGVEANYIAGTPYLGASVRMHPGPGGYQGEMIAWDVKNARQVWGIKDEKFPVYSGVLATGGDVVFYGTMEGWFRAVHSMAVQDRLGHRREPRHLHRA